MVEINEKSRGRNRVEYIGKIFNSTIELRNYLDNTPADKTWEKEKLMKTYEKKYSKSDFKESFGVESIQEAQDHLVYGWEDGFEHVNKIKNGNEKKEIKHNTFKNDVYGFCPNVPAAIMGLPQSMINIERQNKEVQKRKIIHIVYDNVVSWNISSRTLLDNAKKMVSVISMLEKSGYRVELYSIFSGIYYDVDGEKNKKVIQFGGLKIKDSSQQLNLKKIMYPLSHPSWCRVTGFMYEEKSRFYEDGRGSVLMEENYQNKIASFFDKKGVYFNTQELIKLNTRNILDKLGIEI